MYMSAYKTWIQNLKWQLIFFSIFTISYWFKYISLIHHIYIYLCMYICKESALTLNEQVSTWKAFPLFLHINPFNSSTSLLRCFNSVTKNCTYVKHDEMKRGKFTDRCMTENYFSFNNIIYIQDLVFWTFNQTTLSSAPNF